MPLVSPFHEVISNPLVIALLGTQMAGNVAGAFNQSQQQGEQDAVNAALASGAPVDKMPREGLSGLIAKTGLISPDRTVDPNIMNKEKIALQDQQSKRLGEAAQAYTAFGAGALKNPLFANTGLSSMMSPDAIDAGTSALATKMGIDPKMLAGLPPAQQKFVLEQSRQEQFHKDTEADRAATRTSTDQARAATEEARKSNESIRLMTVQMQDDSRKAQQRIEQERNDETRRGHFDQAMRQLDSAKQKATSMLSSASPADPKSVQTLFDSLNAQGTALKGTADKYGYEYDPAQFDPMNVGMEKKHWYSLGPSPIAVSGKADATAVAKSAAAPAAATTAEAVAPPADATAAIKNKTGKVVGHRLKDGSIEWIGGKAPTSTAAK